MLPYPPFSDNGQATLLRGFGYTIATLKKPTLKVVSEIASDIGLVLIQRQEYQQLINDADVVDDIAIDHMVGCQDVIDKYEKLLTQLKFVLLAQAEPNTKLETIKHLLIEPIPQ